jgi:hypothetical protein
MAECERPLVLVQFPALLFTTTLTRECLLRPAFVARLQIERVLLDILDDIFLLHLALEAAEGALNGFAFLDFNFSHAVSTPLASGRSLPQTS